MKTVLITGASSGLGAAMALRFARRGMRLGLVARRVEQLERVAHQVEQLGGRATVYPADVRKTERMSEVLQCFARDAGGLDCVIANAGMGESQPGARFDPRAVAEVFEVNCIGLANTLLPALPIMSRQQSGVLVGMSSIAGYRAMPGSLAYSATKAAVLTFMEGLSMELRGTGIFAMSVHPGFVRTPMTDVNSFPMPFRIEPDDAARRIERAIDERVERFDFPLPFAIGKHVLKWAPRSWLLRILPRAGYSPPSKR